MTLCFVAPLIVVNDVKGPAEQLCIIATMWEVLNHWRSLFKLDVVLDQSPGVWLSMGCCYIIYCSSSPAAGLVHTNTVGQLPNQQEDLSVKMDTSCLYSMVLTVDIRLRDSEVLLSHFVTLGQTEATAAVST